MKNQPNQKLEILETADKKFIIVNGIIATFLVITSYFVFKNTSDLLGKTASFTVLVFIQSFIFVDMWLSHGSLRRHIKSLFSIIFISAFALPFVAQFIILQSSFLASVFKIQTISVVEYFIMIIISGLAFVGIKGAKAFLKL